MTETREEVLEQLAPGLVINSVVLGSAGPYGIRSETVATISGNQVTTRMGTTFNKWTGYEVDAHYPDPFRVIVSDVDAAIYRRTL